MARGVRFAIYSDMALTDFLADRVSSVRNQRDSTCYREQQGSSDAVCGVREDQAWGKESRAGACVRVSS